MPQKAVQADKEGKKDDVINLMNLIRSGFLDFYCLAPSYIMLELFGMMRILNCAMSSLGVFIGALIAIGFSGVFALPLLFALAAVFTITAGGNVLNDYLDYEADKINRPDRPIPSGKVPRTSALAFSLILFVTGNFLAFMINGLCFTIAMVNTALLIIYSVSFQHKVLIGNFTVGYLVGSVFLFGAAVFLTIKSALILTVLAMLANAAREIVKDLDDMEGDKAGFLKKIISKTVTPVAERFGITSEGVRMKYTERGMIIIAIACIMLAILFSILPYYYGMMKTGYLAVVLIADAVFASCMYSLSREAKRKKGYRRISKRLKIGMLIAMIAFIVGIVF